MTISLYKNSFVTLEDAQVYFEERYDSDKWFTLDEEEKEKLLITASKRINLFDFVGVKEVETQAMAFPRDFGTPQDIKDAVCEEAIVLAEKSGTIHSDNQKMGISSISLGAGSVSYGGNGGEQGGNVLVSDIAIYLVKKWTRKGFKFSQ